MKAFDYIRQVRQETAKVTWPSRKEVVLATIMVFIFVSVAATFFFLSDQFMNFLVKSILGLGG